MNFSELLRPKSLELFVGQQHLLSKNSSFRKLIESGTIPHSFFFGPPGSGKTSLARAIASTFERAFFELNATTLKVEEIRRIVDNYQNSLMQPLIFIDEVHRLSKTQQEVLLPVMEQEKALIIGASTENPFFALTGGIRSRSMLFEFKPLCTEELEGLLERAKELCSFTVDDDAKEYLISSSAGDARAMLKLLEFAVKVDKTVTKVVLKSLRPHSLTDGVSSGDTHYNLASALIKSVRGSNPDAAVYYLARLVAGGEEPRFIARRLIILASEDIGNANPNALILASAAFDAVEKLGYPEARIILSQVAIYLACSPKSNSAYLAVDDALSKISAGLIMDVPDYLKDTHTLAAKNKDKGSKYLYPHDFGGFVKQKYLQKEQSFVHLNDIGFEKTLKEWLSKIRGEKPIDKP